MVPDPTAPPSPGEPPTAAPGATDAPPSAEEKPAKPRRREKKAEKEEAPKPAEEVPRPESPEAPADETERPRILIDWPPLFGKYTWEGLEVHDRGLVRYINIEPVITPHTGGRHANRPFGKRRLNIVERLINNMMRSEQATGMKNRTYRTVRDAFAIIHRKSSKNPIQVLIDAVVHAAPREEVTRLRYGGISVPKAVDVASSRRLDVSIRNICKGALAKSHGSKKRIEDCLADELLLAAAGDLNSAAMAKKDEVERVAASAR